MRILFIAIVLVVATLPGYAAAFAQQAPQKAAGSSLRGLFEWANVAASRGDHANAIAGYRKLIEAGVHDPDVYFNLGTSFAQSGDFPRAILNYERALLLRPNETQASENLRDAEKALEEQRAELEGEATIQRSSSISDAAYGNVSEDALAYALLLANWVFFLALAAVSTGRWKHRSIYALLLAAGAVLLVAALGLATKAGLLRDGPRVVTLEDRVVLREGPDPRAQLRGEARGGDRGELIGRDGDFVKLRLVSGLEGWTTGSGVGLIDLDYDRH